MKWRFISVAELLASTLQPLYLKGNKLETLKLGWNSCTGGGFQFLLKIFCRYSGSAVYLMYWRYTYMQNTSGYFLYCVSGLFLERIMIFGNVSLTCSAEEFKKLWSVSSKPHYLVVLISRSDSMLMIVGYSYRKYKRFWTICL